jgi:CRP/FNR family transcriptional regulator, cyclic AMP receptor protein
MSHATPPIVDLLGYAAAGLVLLAFSMRSLTALRAVAIASNVLFMAYAMGAHLSPVFALHAVLLPVNLWRLWQRPRSGPRQVARRRDAMDP